MSINALGVASSDLSLQVGTGNATPAAVSKIAVAGPQVAAEDTTSFTSDKQTVASLGQAALQTFPSRQDKIEALKQAVDSAQYQLDSVKIAESLVNAEV